MTILNQIKSLFTARSVDNPHVEVGSNDNVPYPSTFGYLYSGVYVNESAALTISAFYDGVNTISDDLAQLPIGIYKKDDAKSFRASLHPADNLLSREPNDNLTSFDWRKELFLNVLIKGNSFTRIHRNKNTARLERLEPINPDKVDPFYHEGDLYYKIYGVREALHNSEIIHIKNMRMNSLLGKGVISYAAESMGIALAAQKFGKKYFEESSNPTGVIEAEKTIHGPAKKAMASSWNANYSGNGPKGVAILDEGMKYKKISITPEEAQFINTRKYSVTDIARWLKIPPHKLKDLEKSAFNNMEQQNMEYVQSCLMAWIVQTEQELYKKIFTAKEKAEGYYVKFNVNGLLRGDLKTRSQFYKDMFYIGAYSPNDIRELEDDNPREGGDEYFIPVNMNTSEQIEQNLKNSINE